jgi:alanine dehydrogenase
MHIGIPREIKNHEYRVGAVPDGVHALVAAGHAVMVEKDAGAHVGFSDDAYRNAGATVGASAADVYAADMIIKVKEIQRSELALLHHGQIIYGYHHFAPDRPLLEAMLAAGVACVAYETITDAAGRLPLLTPMSQIAGRLAPQVGAWAIQMANGGSGILLGGVPGVLPANVLVIGGGTVGESAARIALGMGASVTLLDRSAERLAQLEATFDGRLKGSIASPQLIRALLPSQDLVIGAVLLPGARAPRLITRGDLRSMRPGSVIVDVAIDQGGIFETSRPTSHTEPLYVEEGVVHYCVPNMPSAVARTATLALTQATLPHALQIATLGLRAAVLADPHLAAGLQTCNGRITHSELARDLEMDCVTPAQALA